MTFADKVTDSLSLINMMYKNAATHLFLGHSGGKDSCVIFHLATRVIKPRFLRVIHNPKPETHPATVQFLYQVAAHHPIEFVPVSEMKNWVETNFGWPNYGIQIDGSRRYEATRTDGRSTDIVKDGQNISRSEMPPYVANGVFGLHILYPILNWTDAEVWDYITAHEIRVSDEYNH